MKEKPYLFQIDLIRIISAVAIVIIHVSKFIFENKVHYDNISWTISLFLSYFFRWGTPLFIMISGYLLLKSDSSLNSREFYQKRIRKLIWPMVFWNIFYFYLRCRLNGEAINWSNFLGRIWNGGAYYHLYFLYLIWGLYLITPWLKKLIIKGIDLNLWVPTLVILSYSYYLGEIFLNWPFLSNALSWFVLYIGYYLMGYWLSTIKIKNKRILWLLLILLIIGIGTSVNLINIYGTDDLGVFLIHRLSPIIAMAAGVIFINLVNWKMVINNEKITKQLRMIANLGLGVYLIHPAVLEIFVHLEPFNGWKLETPLQWIIGSTLMTLILSCGLVAMIKKMPILKRVV